MTVRDIQVLYLLPTVLDNYFCVLLRNVMQMCTPTCLLFTIPHIFLLWQKREEEERHQGEEEIKRAEEKRARELYISLEQEQRRSEKDDKEWEEQRKSSVPCLFCLQLFSFPVITSFNSPPLIFTPFTSSSCIYLSLPKYQLQNFGCLFSNLYS